MIVLTGVIALAALYQAWFIWKQARILKASENRAKERDVPSMRMTPLTRSFTRIVLNQHTEEVTETSYAGFTVTNAGFVQVEITSFSFEVGWLPSTATQDAATARISFEPVRLHGDSTVSTMSLPHRLRHGESFHVLFDRDQLIRESAKLDGETPIHLRPYCNDSLGNKHHPHHGSFFGGQPHLLPRRTQSWPCHRGRARATRAGPPAAIRSVEFGERPATVSMIRPMRRT